MKKIKQIIFYVDNDLKNALIIYNNNELQKVSNDIGKKRVEEYCLQEKITSLSDSKIHDNILFLTKADLTKKLENISKIDKSNKDKNKGKNINTKHIKIKKKALYIILLSIILGNTEGKFQMVDIYDFIFNNDSNSNDYIRPIKSADKYNNVYEILSNRGINANKRNYISNIWRVLNVYNTFSSDKLHYKNQKLAHSFEEIESQYLIFNMLSEDQINDIYLQGELDFKLIKDNYKSANKEDIKYRIVQTEPFPTDSLLIDYNNRRLYDKYEYMLINFNNEKNYDRKKKAANRFFKTVRKDFKNKQDISNAYLPIKSIIDAMQIMCCKTKSVNSLSKKEKIKINELYNEKMENNFQHYLTYNLKNKVTSDDVTVTIFKDVAIRKLKSNNDYNIDARDISKNKIYRKQLKWKDKKS